MRVLVVLILFGLASASPSSAQDCGLNCNWCGLNKWEGRSFSFLGPYDMKCTYSASGSGCATCSESSAAEDGVTADLIAEILLSARPGDVRAIVAAYGDRLLLIPERNGIAVKGIGCSAASIAKLVILPRAAMQAFMVNSVGLRARPALLSEYYAKDRLTMLASS